MTAILRIREKNPLIADQVATNYRKADSTPRQRAMLEFVAWVTGSNRNLALFMATIFVAPIILMLV